ncbi:GD16107 [Drosophila simulans]|uniref:GD16107 n=1 Tax=Drosophila simulans TaxID=7240 RepID=B4R6J9_DROSI|nr:GD16107 [Drosophila simulans]
MRIRSAHSTPTRVYLHLLMVWLPLLAVHATPAISPQSLRGIIFPKETFDECNWTTWRGRRHLPAHGGCPSALTAGWSVAIAKTATL